MRQEIRPLDPGTINRIAAGEVSFAEESLQRTFLSAMRRPAGVGGDA